MGHGPFGSVSGGGIHSSLVGVLDEVLEEDPLRRPFPCRRLEVASRLVLVIAFFPEPS